MTRKGKVVLVCGLIGSGKTTFANKFFDMVTDYDVIGSKVEQIKQTLDAYQKGNRVAHITTFPSDYEQQELLNKIDPCDLDCYWIDKDERESFNNIINRKRARDMQRLEDIKIENKKIMGKKLTNGIHFHWKYVKY